MSSTFLSTDVGRAQQAKLYESLDVIGLTALQVGPEAMGWSKLEITSLDVWKNFSSNRLPGGSLRTIYKHVLGEDKVLGGNAANTFENVKNGVYDFWEWNSAYVDQNQMETRNATLKTGTTYKYHYSKSLHQTTGTHDLVFKRTYFEMLGAQKRAWILQASETVAKQFYHESLQYKNKVLEDMKLNRDGWSGVSVVDTIPHDILEAYVEASNAVSDAVNNTDFQQARAEIQTICRSARIISLPRHSYHPHISDFHAALSAEKKVVSFDPL